MGVAGMVINAAGAILTIIDLAETVLDSMDKSAVRQARTNMVAILSAHHKIYLGEALQWNNIMQMSTFRLDETISRIQEGTKFWNDDTNEIANAMKELGLTAEDLFIDGDTEKPKTFSKRMRAIVKKLAEIADPKKRQELSKAITGDYELYYLMLKFSYNDIKEMLAEMEQVDGPSAQTEFTKNTLEKEKNDVVESYRQQLKDINAHKPPYTGQDTDAFSWGRTMGRPAPILKSEKEYPYTEEISRGVTKTTLKNGDIVIENSRKGTKQTIFVEEGTSLLEFKNGNTIYHAHDYTTHEYKKPLPDGIKKWTHYNDNYDGNLRRIEEYADGRKVFWDKDFKRHEELPPGNATLSPNPNPTPAETNSSGTDSGKGSATQTGKPAPGQGTAAGRPPTPNERLCQCGTPAELAEAILQAMREKPDASTLNVYTGPAAVPGESIRPSVYLKAEQADIQTNIHLDAIQVNAPDLNTNYTTPADVRMIVHNIFVELGHDLSTSTTW